jgi:hypothetical protein
MAFDKNAQRARLAEVEFQMLAKGFKKPAAAVVPVTKIQVPDTRLKVLSPPVQPAVKTKKEPKMAVNYSAEPFTNHLGQVIQVGQKVVCVSQGYNHTTKVSLGTYLGLRHRNGGGVRNVVVTRTEEKHGYQVNGKSASYKTPGASYGKFTHTGKTSLPSKRIYPTV